MDIKDAIKIKELILNDLHGTILPPEKTILDQWINLTPENKTLYNKIAGVHFMRQVVQDDTLEFTRTWNNLARLTTDRKRRQIRRVWSYAAAVLMIVSIVPAVLFFHTKDGHLVNPQDASTDTLARIRFSDGTIFPIQHTNRCITTNQDLSLVNTPDSIILSSKATGQQEIRWNTIYIPKGMDYIVQLDDGTSIHLSAESSLQVPSRFENKERRVVLQGEAYFNVQHDDKRPFIVETRRANIKVLGTQFNIRAYDDDSKMLTTLLHGSVEVCKAEHRLILEPGMQASVTTDTITSYPVSTARYTAWKDRRLVFDNQTIEEIIQELKHWYDYHFVITDPMVHKLRFSMNIERFDDFKMVQKAIESIEKIKFNIEEKTVRIKMQ